MKTPQTPNPQNKNLRTPQQQKQINNMALALSQLFGAEVASKETVEKLTEEKTELLRKNQDLEEVKEVFVKYYCKLLLFLDYHRKWKPTTRKIEKRTKKLIKEKLYIQLDSNLPTDVRENLEEAYLCYIHGQEISSYLVLLRTLEITINHIYDPVNNPTRDFVPARKKLEWINKQGYISGAEYFVMKGFIEGRNDAIHTVYRPTEKQLFSAMETIVTLVKSLDPKK